MDLLRSGEYLSRVPVMVGSCRDEGNMCFVAAAPNNITDAELAPYLRKMQGNFSDAQIDAIKRVYDPAVYDYPSDLGNYSASWWTGLRIAADLNLGHCCVRKVARWLSRTGAPSVRAFIFAHPPLHEAISYPALAFHGSEIAYVFDVLNKTAPGDERDLAAAVSSYWVRFAASGDPNHPSAPAWPEYTSGGGETGDVDQRLATAAEGGVRSERGLRRAACDYWDAQGDAWAIPGAHC